jgi:hypothetical protein
MQCITTRLHRRENYATVENRYDELVNTSAETQVMAKTFTGIMLTAKKKEPQNNNDNNNYAHDQVAGSCECGNERLGTIRCGEFHDQLRTC